MRQRYGLSLRPGMEDQGGLDLAELVMTSNEAEAARFRCLQQGGMNVMVLVGSALESMGKDAFPLAKILPTPVLGDQYFNDSTAVGDEGKTDARGPWEKAESGKSFKPENYRAALKPVGRKCLERKSK
jgi:hypothetical protein